MFLNLNGAYREDPFPNWLKKIIRRCSFQHWRADHWLKLFISFNPPSPHPSIFKRVKSSDKC